MSYQVLARKWRPQRFDDVVGQQAVTRTLRNAIASGRIAQAFVFAGSRGCGKTTTARILARALNCVKGPTPDPCGECDACIEIAQGRDIDVLEIDAASHTGIDNIRDVVIAGLTIAPVRNRFKAFIIDEVHQLSSASFNALLKSIEEPPPHVVFMMATTELHKIPDTILSRSQVFEFRTIPTGAIAAQLKRIAAAEEIQADEAALMLIARSAEGSMRDAQSALDQVIAFAGSTMSADDVATVLGLVGRDLLFGLIEAVVAEDAPRALSLADRASESGHDLKLVCRELSRVMRDLMLVSVDPDRVGDGELAEGERERLQELSARFSREDLMRAFDLLSRAEQEIRNASQPRYYFEMALLRWMHLRKLVPLADLLTGAAPTATGTAKLTAPTTGKSVSPAPAATGTGRASLAAAVGTRTAAAPPAARVAPPASPAPRTATAEKPKGTSSGDASSSTTTPSNLKDALLAEIRATKGFFYNTVVAQALKIETTPDSVTFTFSPIHKALREQFEQSRGWLETTSERIAGRRIAVVAQTGPGAEPSAPKPAEKAPADKRDLKAEAMATPAVQAMLEVFPAEVRDVEEM
jgi:DNA polymerase-3 subunit gamma/tau